MEKSPQLDALPAEKRSAHEFAVQEARPALLRSIHQECGPDVDWNAVRKSRGPIKPVLEHRRESLARLIFQTYKPPLLDKLLGRAQPKVYALAEEVRKAKAQDEEEFRDAANAYRQDHAEWVAARELAGKVLQGDADGYASVVQEATPFFDFSLFGSEVHLTCKRETVGVELRVNGKAAVPAVTKSLREDGTLCIEMTPKAPWLKLYQDFVCGSVLRVGRELFALLPISKVVVAVKADVVNPETGHPHARTILFVAIPRRTLASIEEWDTVDPAATMAQLAPRMSFNKSTGFEAIEPLSVADAKVRG